MNKWVMLRTTAAAVLFAAVGIALAQQPEKLPPPKPTDKAKEKDPTVPSTKMKEALGPPKTASGKSASGVPKITLKGKVLVRGRMPLALVDIDGTLYTIGRNGQFTAGGVTYRVLRLDAEEVRLEAGTKKDIITLP